MAPLNPPGGVRQRRYRERQKERRAVARVEFSTDAVIQSLVTTGRLSQDEAANRDRVERELARILENWAEMNTARHLPSPHDAVVERERLDSLLEADPIASHDAIMAATAVPVPAVVFKEYDRRQVPLIDDTDTDNGDVDPPPFTYEQMDVMAEVLAQTKLDLAAQIEAAIAPLSQRLAVLEGQMSLLTALLGNSKSYEASEVIRKIRVP
jgi:hypothetical protein